MATTAIAGYSGMVSGAGANSATEIKSWQVTITTEALDATSMSSNGWREFICGLRGATGTFTCIGTHPTVSTVNTNSITLDTNTGAGGFTISGTCIITSVEYGDAVDGVVTYTAQFTMTGTVTIT